MSLRRLVLLCLYCTKSVEIMYSSLKHLEGSVKVAENVS